MSSDTSDPTLGATAIGESVGDATFREPELLARLLEGPHELVRLRHYVLLERLGHGGMGVVFAAYDETLERKVALKLLRHVANTTAQRRLVREAQAMARLSHPNVVQIYEIGEVEGLTFIVMEYVEGLTLAQWRKAAPRSRAEILAVFVAAGRGLAAAHEQNLVHRDFKPDNVMISSDGRVRVMDFGIAREDGLVAEPAPLDHPGELALDLTATGVMMGTPAYMAPEQFRGEKTDTRTDQFSFCVALWEALHDQRPFVGRTIPELSVAVSSGELVAPRKGDVPHWLHELLVRGLAVEPEHRHASMAALLRALQDDPTRRHRAWALGAGLVAILAASFIWIAVDERRTRAQTLAACDAEGRAIASDWNESRAIELHASFAASKSPLASSAWAHLEPRLHAYTRDWTRLRTEVCRETRIDHARDQTNYDAIAACLDEHRAIFAALLEAWQVGGEQAVDHATFAAANLAPVSVCTSEAWLAHRIEPPQDPREHERVIALRAQLHRIAALRLAGNFRAAADEALLVLDEAEQLGWAPLVAEARVELGEARGELGEYPDARVLVEQAFLDAIAAGHDRIALQAATAATVTIGYFMVDFDRGLYWGRIATSLIERMGLAGTPQEAALLTAVGHVRWARGDHDEALDAYAGALRIHEATLGAEHPVTAEALGNVGYMHKERGDYEQATAHYQRALEIHEATLGPDHPEVATTLLYIADVLTRRGDYERALDLYQRGLAIYERGYGPDHPAVASALNDLSGVLIQSGRHDEALGHLRRALELHRAAFGPEHPAVASVLENTANAQLSLGDQQAALAAAQEALRINVAAFGPEHARVESSRELLARVQSHEVDTTSSMPASAR
jgi:tetratricopeptide (TPR) repeat protein/predicted Ser/Thr protein kinase